jgi:mannose-6-phosphate isomerase-like protein (cupin superfamily)
MPKEVKIVNFKNSMPDVSPKGRARTPLFSDGLAENVEVVYQRIAPGNRGAYHYHQHAENVWIVLQGELEVIVGGARHYVQEGEAIFLPNEIPHSSGNRGEIDMLAVEIYAPSITRFDPRDSFPADLPEAFVGSEPAKH